MWSSLKNYSDGALLVCRAGLGILLLCLHGWPILAGGLSGWRSHGIATLRLGVLPTFWGFLVGLLVALACVLLIVGLFFRPAVLLLLCVAAFAVLEGFTGAWLRSLDGLVLALFFLCLLFVGPGRFSFDKS